MCVSCLVVFAFGRQTRGDVFLVVLTPSQISLSPLLLVGRPVDNPSETYPYSSLPHCHNPNNNNHNATYRFELSTRSWLPPIHSEPTGFPIRFQEHVEKNRVLCRQTLSPKDWKALCEAVRNKYAIEFDVVVSPFETLPTLALVGTVLLDEIHLNHLAFSLGYSVPHNEIVWAKVATHVRTHTHARTKETCNEFFAHPSQAHNQHYRIPVAAH